ncbi:MAG: proline/glycine betaine ABC transporter permease, partial [Deltaproteobacteria bacterium]|nr:proline/glycine betaine ABC transporter permease [Deltaproteobacteria bacterium]
MTWLQEFPTLDQTSLRALKKAFDSGYRSFSRSYGDAIEGFFDPLLYFLVWFERLLRATPWWLVIVVVAFVCYVAGRSRRLSGFVAVALFLIGYLGM